MVYFIHIYKKKGERKKIKMIQSLLEHLHKLFVLDVCLLGVAFKALIYSFSSRLILQQYFSVWWWVKKDVCDFHIRIRCVRKTDFVTAGYVLTQLNIRGYCRRREVVVYFLSVSFYVHLFFIWIRSSWSFLKCWCIEFSTSPTGLILNNSREVLSLRSEYRCIMNNYKS